MSCMYLHVFARSAEPDPAIGRQLCTLCLQLLREQQHYGCDVLLQVTKPTPEDSTVVLPLAQYVKEH